MENSNFFPHKQYLLGLSSLKMQRRPIQTKVYCKPYYVSQEVAAAKKAFRSVYIIDRTCFNECFLFHVITRRHYFLSLSLQWFSATAMLLCSLKQVFWKKSAFYIHYRHNNITMPLIRKVQNKVLPLNKMFLNKIYCW